MLLLLLYIYTHMCLVHECLTPTHQPCIHNCIHIPSLFSSSTTHKPSLLHFPQQQHQFPPPPPPREILYLDLALEAVVRSAAERGAGAFGMGAAPLVAPLLANLILSVGENEELCYCLKVC